MEKKSFSAKTQKEALTMACLDMGLASDQIDYEVIENAKSGVFGIGSRPCVIMAWKKEEKIIKSGNEEEKEFYSKININNADEKDIAASSNAESAEKFIKDVLCAMGINAEIDLEENVEKKDIFVNIKGKDTGVLIGKHGHTLDALQYLTSQVVNKGRQEYVRVRLDAEGYRKKRKENLEMLADNICSKIKKTGRPVVLEPMNPYERRVIHSAIQEKEGFSTRSEGEEPYRHIVVFQKKH